MIRTDNTPRACIEDTDLVLTYKVLSFTAIEIVSIEIKPRVEGRYILSSLATLV
jgi:hypothetical protein